MPETSADSYINSQPETAVSFDDYWKDNNRYGTLDNPDQLMVRFLNFFTGEDKRVKREYDAYLQNLNNRNEFKAVQSARAYDKMMDDTKYQRMMKDFEAAGLNPYLLINNGGISASSAPSSSKGDYAINKKSESGNSQSGRNIALLLLAVARIAAALA